MKPLFGLAVIVLGVLLLIGVDEASASFLTASLALLSVPSGAVVQVKQGCKLVDGQLICGKKKGNAGNDNNNNNNNDNNDQGSKKQKNNTETGSTRTLNHHYRCEDSSGGREQVCPIDKRREFSPLDTGRLLRTLIENALTSPPCGPA